MRRIPIIIAALAIATSAFIATATAGIQPNTGRTSTLWGLKGELFEPTGRLMDWSYAGYGAGEREIPLVPVVANAKDFGAKADGTTDDGAAIEAAINAAVAAGGGAVFLPAGRYLARRRFRLPTGIVLRGETRDTTTLYFPQNLDELQPGNYSFSGGFIEGLGGSSTLPILTTVTETAARGTHQIRVASTDKLAVGDWIFLRQQDVGGSLIEHLYNDHATGDYSDNIGRIAYRFPTRIEAIDGNLVTLERALIGDVETRWSPTIFSVVPRLSEIGVEHLTIEFPVTPYPGHLKEKGYNAIHFNHAWHSWVRDVRIRNADFGVSFTNTFFSTATGVTLDTTGLRGLITGHHGLNNGNGGDNLFIDFDIQTRFWHDLTNEWYAHGVVFARGRGVDLCMDHHRTAPYATLWTELDLGAGTRAWFSGGSGNRGPHTGAWDTLWNITADVVLPLPPPNYGPSMTFFGFHTNDNIPANAFDWHLEHKTGSLPIRNIRPTNLWTAMVARRLPPTIDPGDDTPDAGGDFDTDLDPADTGTYHDTGLDPADTGTYHDTGLDIADVGTDHDTTNTPNDPDATGTATDTDTMTDNNDAANDGCGCQTTGASPFSNAGTLLFLALGAAFLRRRRTC